MFGNLGSLMSLMGNMKKITSDLKTAMAKLKETTVQGSAGGDQVVVTANGLGEITGIKIAPELVQAGDPGVIEEMTLAAIHAALEKVKEVNQQHMGQLSEVLPIGQLKGLLGNFSPDDLK